MLASLVEVAALPGEDAAPCSLTEEDLQMIGESHIAVLSSCRHRGVIEGWAEGLGRISRRLLRSPKLPLHNIPLAWLKTSLDKVASPSESAFSVTRRSAGLPYIVRCMAVHPSIQPQIIAAVQRLLAVAAQPLPREIDQRVDLPQVGRKKKHTLNLGRW